MLIKTCKLRKLHFARYERLDANKLLSTWVKMYFIASDWPSVISDVALSLLRR